MSGRRHVLLASLLLAHACSGDAPNSREPVASAAGTSAQPPAAGSAADAAIPMFGDMPVEVIDLPDEDGGALPLPTNAAAKPPADPSITFEWSESQPVGTACEPGEYTGTFTCTMTLQDELAQLLGVMFELNGPMRLTLERSMNGEFLEIKDGQFDAVVEELIGAHASLTGKLDCRTNRFEAQLFDGVWTVGDPAMPLFPGGALEGTLAGTYQDNALAGTWSISDPALGACVGTWDVDGMR